MGYHVKTMYKQAQACYAVSAVPHAHVVTLLHYAGLPQNRPPARIIVLDTAGGGGTLVHDVDAALDPGSRQSAADPLFPYKTVRRVYIDQLV